MPPSILKSSVPSYCMPSIIPPTSDRDPIKSTTRLIQLQQMFDEDLFQRAAKVESARSVTLRDSVQRNRDDALGQQIMEVLFLSRISLGFGVGLLSRMEMGCSDPMKVQGVRPSADAHLTPSNPLVVNTSIGSWGSKWYSQ